MSQNEEVRSKVRSEIRERIDPVLETMITQQLSEHGTIPTESGINTNTVKGALENNRYTWRTTESISKELGVSPKEIEHIINTQLQDQIIWTYDYKTGQVLYTTREHYYKKETPINRLLATLINQIR